MTGPVKVEELPALALNVIEVDMKTKGVKPVDFFINIGFSCVNFLFLTLDKNLNVKREANSSSYPDFNLENHWYF